jgi:hypothetical protein
MGLRTVMSEFTDQDHWKALILYGLSQATYKIALGKTLLSLSDQDIPLFHGTCSLTSSSTNTCSASH